MNGPGSSVQFSSRWYLCPRKSPSLCAPPPSLTSFPNVAVPLFVWLTMALCRPFKKDLLALPLSTPLFSRHNESWLALCSRVVSQAPQHFRSSGKQATCDGCSVRRTYLPGRFPSLRVIVQELCESRGGRPGLSVLMSLLASVDVKFYWTMLRHWSHPNMSTTSEDIRHHFIIIIIFTPACPEQYTHGTFPKVDVDHWPGR